MKNAKRNGLSFFAVAFFIFLALASKVNKIHYGALQYNNPVEENSDKGNYIVKNDGTMIYGQNIRWKSGLLVKDQIIIDDQKFKISEIRGYRDGSTYHGRLKNEYIKRIVHGKINLYVQFTEVTTTTTNNSGFSHTSSYTRTDQYAQRGEDGPMIGIAGQKDIKELLSDCPAAVEMIDISNSKMRKAIRKNSNYINSVFDIYNNGCK